MLSDWILPCYYPSEAFFSHHNMKWFFIPCNLFKVIINFLLYCTSPIQMNILWQKRLKNSFTSCTLIFLWDQKAQWLMLLILPREMVLPTIHPPCNRRWKAADLNTWDWIAADFFPQNHRSVSQWCPWFFPGFLKLSVFWQNIAVRFDQIVAKRNNVINAQLRRGVRIHHSGLVNVILPVREGRL